MTRTLVTVRKARRAYTCDKCGGLIAPGDLYEDSRLPPGDDTVNNLGWWRSKSHVGAWTR